MYIPFRVDDEFGRQIVELAAAETGTNVSMLVRRLLDEALTAREAPQAASPVTVPAEMVREAVRSPQPVVLPIHDGADPVQPSGAHLSALSVEPAEVEPVVYSDEERAVVDVAFQAPSKRSKMTQREQLRAMRDAKLGRI
jgi:hypothetical protein